MMFKFKNSKLLTHLNQLIDMINIEGMATDSFRSLFNQENDFCTLNVTSNQFRRIKHYLQILSIQNPTLWNNPLFMALCLEQWTACNNEEVASLEYLEEVQSFYSNPILTKNAQEKEFQESVLFDKNIHSYVIAESHGTIAPINFLKSKIKELIKIKATVSIEGLSEEELAEVRACNLQKACSLLLYMLIPVEKSMGNISIATAKRQLIATLISEGIKIIPGDNQYSINLNANSERLRLYNYSAIQNARLYASNDPIIYWVGRAHAITTKDCPSITSLLGAQLIDLTLDDANPISQGLYKESKMTLFSHDQTLNASVDLSSPKDYIGNQ